MFDNSQLITERRDQFSCSNVRTEGRSKVGIFKNNTARGLCNWFIEWWG